MSHHRIALLVIAAAAVLDAGLGLAFAAVEHLPAWHGLFCGLANAVTDGGDVAPTNPAGYAITAAEYLLVVPLFAATFSLFTSALGSVHVRREVDQAEKRLSQDADRRHALMQAHVGRLLGVHCTEVKAHVSAVVADAQVKAGAGTNPAEGLPADERAVPPAATTRKKRT